MTLIISIIQDSDKHLMVGDYVTTVFISDKCTEHRKTCSFSSDFMCSIHNFNIYT